MSTGEAKQAYRQRKQLVEPVFGIIKEQQQARRFLLRGLPNVAAEWTLPASAFNLSALRRIWRPGCRTLTSQSNRIAKSVRCRGTLTGLYSGTA